MRNTQRARPALYSTCMRLRLSPPTQRQVFTFFKTMRWRAFLEELTGIGGLVAGVGYDTGTGIHLTAPGGKLEVHADFNSGEFGLHSGLHRRGIEHILLGLRSGTPGACGTPPGRMGILPVLAATTPSLHLHLSHSLHPSLPPSLPRNSQRISLSESTAVALELRRAPRAVGAQPQLLPPAHPPDPRPHGRLLNQ